MQMIISVKKEKFVFFFRFFNKKPYPPAKKKRKSEKTVPERELFAHASFFSRSGNSSQASVTFWMFPNRSKRGSAENM